ncbi:MAG: S8 family serine peptidase [Candidatus Kapaibacterium sp.]|nr:S8 family serine peptidase [Candidatus Kapabacteria bacterium]
MKNIILILLLIMTFNVYSEEYENGKIAVKFNIESRLSDKLRNGQISRIDEFLPIIGAHHIESYVDDRLVDKLMNRQQNLSLGTKISGQGIDRIFIIKYERNIDPKIASMKLSKSPLLEYAEPIYKRYIFQDSIPDDPLVFEQYYLRTTDVFDSWKHIDTINKKIVLSVVDTGVDYLHEDLEGTLYINSGEDGIDDEGNDKRNNGIDDDNNGFIDDWMGWDYGADNDGGEDNDPLPGHAHGTHVAGVIAGIKNNSVGIAGIGLNVAILPVKIGFDNPQSKTLIRSYDGILYAAMNGADIINCSWGGGGFSLAEQDIINQADDLGSLIIAAAGNNWAQMAFYPASYERVISVAAVDSNDRKAGFSNSHSTVDVSAPGVAVMSAIPGDSYAAWDGTSMASPIAAAIASMIKMNHPEYTNRQIGEHLKATSDDISHINEDYDGLIGAGRVNAYKAVTTVNPVSISLINYSITEEIPDGVIQSGETLEISIELFNALNPLYGVNVFANSNSEYPPVFFTDSIYAGDFGMFETKMPSSKIKFRTPDEDILNYILPITLTIIDDEGRKFTNTVSIFLNPTWRNMDENDITLTYSSQGNIAYDDFPDNTRGVGMLYKNSSNLLFEGALMVGFSHEKLANSARGSSGSAKNRDFIISRPITVAKPGDYSDMETYTEFTARQDSLVPEIRVLQTGYQFKGFDAEKISYVVYDIINESDSFQDSVCVALYLDWDIGPSGSNNQATWLSSNGFGYQKNTSDESFPIAGVMMISELPPSFFAIDNDGESEDNPGVYDGFTKEEKWMMMSKGLSKLQSSVTDASMVIGAGPFSLRAGDTMRVAFALFAGHDLDQLINTSQKAFVVGKKFNPDGNYASRPKNNRIDIVYPNPASSILTVELAISDINYGKLGLWDSEGKFIKQVYEYNSLNSAEMYPRYHRVIINLDEYSQGQYYLKFHTDKGESLEIVNIVR